MKRKLTSLLLAIAVMFSVSIPTLAADGRDGDTCPNELLWQLFLRGCCGNGQVNAQTDWSTLLRAWLTQQTPQTDQPQSDVPGQGGAPTQGETPQQAKPQQPEKPAQTEKPTETDGDAQGKPAQTEAQQSAQTVTSSAYEQEVVRLVNAERAKEGLAPLSVDAALTRTARMKSQDMHDNGYFDHQSPTYGSPFDLMKAQGVRYRTAGENIAMGYRTPEAVVAAWMASPGHRANILNASYTKIGVGYVASGNYWTQHFTG